MSERTRFIFEMMMLALLGIALTEGSRWLPHEAAPVKSIGEAIIVAALLGATVDPYLKRKLSDEMFGSALRAIFGKGLPKPIQEEMQRIAACNVVREHYVAEYKFEKITSGQVELHIRVEYTARNISTENQRFEHIMKIEDSSAGSIVRMKCSGCEGGDYDDKQPNLKAEPFEGGWRATRDVTLRPGQIAKFRGETKRRLPIIWDDVMYFANPTIGVRVRVFSNDELDVKIVSMHQVPVRHTNDEGELELEGVAFLPNMSFIVRWRPRVVQ